MLCLPRNLHVKKQVKTLIAMEERTGDHRRPRDSQSLQRSMEVHKVLCLPRILRMEVHKVLCPAHGGSQSAAPATKTAHGASQSAAPATKCAHGGSQSAVPSTKSARQETSENSNRNGGTDRRPPATTQQPEPPTEHGGSQSAVPATNSGDVSVCVVTKCCACHEICTWRFTKCCACHEVCASRNK